MQQFNFPFKHLLQQPLQAKRQTVQVRIYPDTLPGFPDTFLAFLSLTFHGFPLNFSSPGLFDTFPGFPYCFLGFPDIFTHPLDKCPGFLDSLPGFPEEFPNSPNTFTGFSDTLLNLFLVFLPSPDVVQSELFQMSCEVSYCVS